MRVLAVSNLYPPASIGGYELQCEQVVDGLRQRGHDVHVLTSFAAADATDLPDVPDDRVHRSLHLHPAPPPGERRLTWQGRRLRTYLRNARVARRLVRRLRPEVVTCWSPARTGLATILPACELAIPVVCFLDDWSTEDEWRVLGGASADFSGGRRAAIARSMYAPLRRRSVGLVIDEAVFVSSFMQRTFAELSVPLPVGTVVHQGIRFRQPPLTAPPPSAHRRLVAVARVTRTKGLHLAVDALRVLRTELGHPDVRLTIVGGERAEDRDYGRHLRARVAAAGLTDAVDFLGPHPPADVFRLLPGYRVFLSTSMWEEPGPATPLEALGHGVPVVATDVGGLRDYVRDGVDGLLVPRGDPRAMAEAVARLLEDEASWQAMRRAGWQRVAEHFSSDRLIDDVVSVLERTLERRAAVPPRRRAS